MQAKMKAMPDGYDSALSNCPLCGKGPVRRRMTDFRGNGIDLCGHCGVEFMNPQYSETALQKFYAGYIAMHPGPADAKASDPADADARVADKARNLSLLENYAPGRRILMVGCGDGMEIRAATGSGWRVEGFDVDPTVTSKVAEREGVPVHCGDFHKLPQKVGEFDALYLDQVIEHPRDPGRYLETCKELLRSGGVLFLGLPNMGSLSNRLKTLADRLRLRVRRGRHYNTRHHLTYFTPAVIVRHLRDRVGMEVLDVRGSLGPQGNPMVTIVHRFGPFFDSTFIVIARKT